jgi:hypothetical protein
MEKCVRSARQAGIFKQFHVLTDRQLGGCECYDAMQCDKAHGLFKLHYLKAGMTRLLFDYFIWLDADSVFERNPIDILGSLGKSALHVPLEVNLSELTEDRTWRGVSLYALRDLFLREGIMNQPYLSRSAFWIVHREAIEAVYDLALGFWHKAKEAALVVDVSAALGYAMQILCADSEAHLQLNRPDLWASDNPGDLSTLFLKSCELNLGGPRGAPAQACACNGIQEAPAPVRPAIVHLGSGSRGEAAVSASDRLKRTSDEPVGVDSETT